MSNQVNRQRRNFLGSAVAGIATAELGFIGSAHAQTPSPATPAAAPAGAPQKLGPIRQIKAGELDVGYYEAGPANGIPVLLMHGYPYDIHSYADVAPLLAARGCRVIVPHLRGHGTTRFLDTANPRSAQQSAVALDQIALLDALKIDRAVMVGYDWGARTACIIAALWPERCLGLLSVGGYIMTNLPANRMPLPAKAEHEWWYQFYFATERGRAGLEANRKDIARILWTTNSPKWNFDEATFQRSAASFDNPDYVAIVIHNYRWRLGLADGFPKYAEWEKQLATLPVISVPTITMDGDSNGIVPPSDGKAQAAKFSGPRTHQVVQAGHNVPQETPQVFADAVWSLASARH
ncbi:alpha/beta hydrolase [Variovorax sp. dw_954]|uniref:alpha/beta fold hydrolase n=1 Tax=Variovorax sp. dw_954 TaxID=2720078 RepID=UPI001BD1C9B3|nr:alpha/beta hydrolase [Variovorax sp. dw_954]